MFLKVSRLVSRRSLAQEFCDAGLVSVNGSAAKPSREVKPSDVIEIRRRNRITKVTVESVPDKKQVSKEAAIGLFSIISDESTDEI